MSKFKIAVTLEIEADDAKAFLAGAREFAQVIAADTNEDGESILSASLTVTNEKGDVLVQQTVAGAR